MKLFRFEERWVEAVLSGFSSPSGGGLVIEENEVDYLDGFMRMNEPATPLAAFGARAAVWMVALAPLWCLLSLRGVLRRSADERVALMTRMLEHRLWVVRELTLLLKVQASMAMMGTASVRLRSGYDRREAAAEPSDGLVRLPLLGEVA